MTKISYFVEGIQGAGKTTMVGKLARENPNSKMFSEGDYSPVELAWCAYVDEDTYEKILEKYSDIADIIKEKTVNEGDKKIICYTKVKTDNEAFYKKLEAYEIYNGNVSKEEFQNIILSRFSNWKPNESQIFECSLFQNIVENQILFYEMSDDEIVDFYKKVKAALIGKDYQIVYLEVDDIRAAEEIVKKERCDEDGNEIWFSIMTDYIENSPFGRTNNLSGMDGLVKHLEHRVKLEKRILDEVFNNMYSIHKREIC